MGKSILIQTSDKKIMNRIMKLKGIMIPSGLWVNIMEYSDDTLSCYTPPILGCDGHFQEMFYLSPLTQKEIWRDRWLLDINAGWEILSEETHSVISLDEFQLEQSLIWFKGIAHSLYRGQKHFFFFLLKESQVGKVMVQDRVKNFQRSVEGCATAF